MSAPEVPDCVVFNCAKFPSETPPVVPVVQKVIGPLLVAKSLGDEAFAPALVVILPEDFTRIPWVPEVTFPLRSVVPPEDTDTNLVAVVAPPTVELPEETTLMSLPAEIAPVPVVTVELELSIWIS